MARGLYHCSRCKKHFFDAEATRMHINDAHRGEGDVRRHPTKRELLIREEALAAEVLRLREALDGIDVYLSDTLSGRVEPDPSTYKQWLIEGIVMARDRARAALDGKQSSPTT